MAPCEIGFWPRNGPDQGLRIRFVTGRYAHYISLDIHFINLTPPLKKKIVKFDFVPIESVFEDVLLNVKHFRSCFY